MGITQYATTSGFYQPLSVNTASGAPVFTFDPSQMNTFTTSPDLISRWQMQFGLRYIFNIVLPARVQWPCRQNITLLRAGNFLLRNSCIELIDGALCRDLLKCDAYDWDTT